MYKLIIINTVDEAVYFLKSLYSYNKDWFILSTHHAVNDKFSGFDFECHHVSEYYSNEFINEEMNFISDQVNNALSNLDDGINARRTRFKTEENINIFFTLFRYWLKSDYLGISMIQQAINHIKEDFLINSVYYFPNSKLNNLNFSITEIIKSEFSLKVEFFEIMYQSPNRSLIKKAFDIFHKSIEQKQKILPKINGIFNEYFGHIEIVFSKPTILIARPVYDLEDLIPELNDFNVLFFDHDKFFCKDKNKIRQIKVSKSVNHNFHKYIKIIDKLEIELADRRNTVEDPLINSRTCITVRTLLNIFNKRIREIIIPFLSVIDLHKEIDIKLFLWGCPPSAPRSTSLVAEYFLERGIPVVGSQHGGAYGYQKIGFKHQDTDFSRCSHYFSWGFSEKDTEILKNDYLNKISIYPIGKLTRNSQSDISISEIKKTEIDVLFPLTPAVNVLTGPYRINCSMLNKYQNKIFDMLESQSNMSCFIKPQNNYLEIDFQLKERLKRAKNLKVNSLPLNDFLMLYHPRLVVIEYPSTPLLDVLGIDCDLFIFNDPVNPIAKKDRIMLEKRGYIINNIEQLYSLFNLFIENKLEKRRDATFYNYFISGDNSLVKAKDIIHNIIKTNFSIYHQDIKYAI